MEQQSDLTSGVIPLSRRALREAAERDAKRQGLLKRSPSSAPIQQATVAPQATSRATAFAAAPVVTAAKFAAHDDHVTTQTTARAASSPSPASRAATGSRAVAARTMATRTAARQPTPTTHRWIPRAAVLTSLAVATIAVPMSANAGSGAETFLAEATVVDLGATDGAQVGPSAASILGSRGEDAPAPTTLAQSVSANERTAVAASRSADERTSLSTSGCDISVLPTGSNGKLSKTGLCELWGTGNFIRSDAADALTALNDAYVAKYGTNMCISGGYRSLAEQYSIKSTRGSFAATPGTSEHGWGLAVDLCAETYQSSAKTAWLRENAPLFGWDNPAWARPGGSGATEPWHWEFTEGVAAFDKRN